MWRELEQMALAGGLRVDSRGMRTRLARGVLAVARWRFRCPGAAGLEHRLVLGLTCPAADIVIGQRSVTADTAVFLGGHSVNWRSQFWLELQSRYERGERGGGAMRCGCGTRGCPSRLELPVGSARVRR
jgi:hypothetical protein